jgi:hypothetical protein
MGRNAQIGQGEEVKLFQQILKQLERLTKITAASVAITTTTSTTAIP